jgi:hypothetical protein
MYRMEYYFSAMKKNEIMSFRGKWMELEIIILSWVSQVQKDKQKVKCFLLYVETQIYTYAFIYI